MVGNSVFVGAINYSSLRDIKLLDGLTENPRWRPKRSSLPKDIGCFWNIRFL